MPKFNRLGHAPDATPMKPVGVRLDEQTRAMLRAIMDYEDRTTESDMIRVLIRRGYRALPTEAQTALSTIRLNVRRSYMEGTQKRRGCRPNFPALQDDNWRGGR